MTGLRRLFATPVWEGALAAEADLAVLLPDLRTACETLAREDRAGRAWCRTHGYGGYTSYASLDDLPARDPAFAALKRRLDGPVAAFAEACAMDLGPRGRLRLDSLWVSVLRPGAAHSGHIHPHSVVSGTVYVAVPPGAGGLKLEDPRAPLMMAAPPRRPDAPPDLKPWVVLQPREGAVFLWESWLRHEVEPNRGRTPRVSVSFNYAWR